MAETHLTKKWYKTQHFQFVHPINLKTNTDLRSELSSRGERGASLCFKYPSTCINNNYDDDYDDKDCATVLSGYDVIILPMTKIMEVIHY